MRFLSHLPTLLICLCILPVFAAEGVDSGLSEEARDAHQQLERIDRLQLFNSGLANNRLLELSRQIRALDRDADGDYVYGLTLHRLGETKAAMAAFSAAVRKDAGHLDATLMRGVLLRQTQGPAIAAPIFKKVLALAPKHGEALYQLGLTYDDLGESQQSLVCFLACIAVEPDHKGALLRVALNSDGLTPPKEMKVPLRAN